MTNPFTSILIYGMGMMGASLAHALKRTRSDVRITGVVRSESSAAFIQKHGIAAEILIQNDPMAIADLDFEQYDLIVLGIPPHSIIEMAAHIPASNTLITDMSSTRRQVHNALASRTDLRFVGSHPMCGSENRGPQAGLPDLFHGNLSIVIEDNRFNSVTTDDLLKIKQLWQMLGMQCYQMTADKHDQVLAYLSHGPHILSSLLTLWAHDQPEIKSATSDSPGTITGGGFKSMARIAGSNPEMWSDILETNADNILTSLQKFHNMLGDLIERFPEKKTTEWHDWFKKSRHDRNILCGYEE